MCQIPQASVPAIHHDPTAQQQVGGPHCLLPTISTFISRSSPQRWREHRDSTSNSLTHADPLSTAQSAQRAAENTTHSTHLSSHLHEAGWDVRFLLNKVAWGSWAEASSLGGQFSKIAGHHSTGHRPPAWEGGHSFILTSKYQSQGTDHRVLSLLVFLHFTKHSKKWFTQKWNLI